jgi:alkanesulfonate monooxygenase SsuD/methylene tetrahydromethanopterin reductase-like flavin-dependent oxidoreductase (luciferase family)
MPDRMPALSIVATPGRRGWAAEASREAEKRGFSGVYGPSVAGEQLSFLVTLAATTATLALGTSIQPIYFRRAADLAATAGYLHEVSGGRFYLGLGVSHGPVLTRMGVDTGRPLSDMRDYVAALRDAADNVGGLPPVVLASLRDKMLDLAVEVADGAVWANGARSHMGTQLARVPAGRRQAGFFLGDMIPTVVDEDRAAAAAVCRRTLSGYVALPNYRNYWKEAGYREEMETIEKALQARDREAVTAAMTGRWLADVTLFGSAREVREGLDAWYEAGITTPILVPSSTSGGQRRAVEEVFAIF